MIRIAIPEFDLQPNYPKALKALGAEHKTLPVFGVQWHPERMCFEFAKDGISDGSVLLKEF